MQLKRKLTDRRTPYDMLEEAAQNRAAGFPMFATLLEAEADRRIRAAEYKQRLKEAELDDSEYDEEY